MANCFEVRALSPDIPFGVEILGLNPADISNPETQARLRHHWIEDGVLVFRDLEGEDTHLALSRVFGKLIGHPIQAQDPLRREIFTVRFNPENGYLTEVDGEVRGGWLPWHSDLVHFHSINHGGILRPLKLPSRGGETGFIDKIASYESLPDRLKEKIEGRYVLYQFDRNPEHQKFGRITENVRLYRETEESRGWDKRAFPRVLHPMVYTQIETGRKMLNVSPWFAIEIEGMAPAESDALLHEVMEYAIHPRHAYFHQWQMGEMVLWDNWRVLHSATGCPADQERWMERTTIEGDYGMGRMAAEQDARLAEAIEV